MLTYADGSALSRSLTATPESASWMRWAAEHADQLVTSPLGLTELRRFAAPLDALARAKAHRIATEITVLRFSDQSLESAATVSADLPPFTAIHLGLAVAHAEIDRLATYDPVLARAASLYGLDVVTPGRPAVWWNG